MKFQIDKQNKRIIGFSVCSVLARSSSSAPLPPARYRRSSVRNRLPRHRKTPFECPSILSTISLSIIITCSDAWRRALSEGQETKNERTLMLPEAPFRPNYFPNTLKVIRFLYTLFAALRALLRRAAVALAASARCLLDDRLATRL